MSRERKLLRSEFSSAVRIWQIERKEEQFLIDIYPVDSAEFIIPLYTTGFSLQDLPLEGKLHQHIESQSLPFPYLKHETSSLNKIN